MRQKHTKTSILMWGTLDRDDDKFYLTSYAHKCKFNMSIKIIRVKILLIQLTWVNIYQVFTLNVSGSILSTSHIMIQ